MKATEAAQSIVPGALAQGRRSLTPVEARALCEAYGIPVPKDGLVTSAA